MFLKKNWSWVFNLALALSILMLIACPMESDDDDIPLPAPGSIQITANDGALVLQWTRVAAAGGVDPTYKIFISESNNSLEAVEIFPTDGSGGSLVKYTISELENHKTYYIWVKAAYAGLGESDFTGVYQGTPIPPPANPGTLTVAPYEEMLGVSWVAVTDASFYEVYYKAGGAGETPPTDATMETVAEPTVMIEELDNGTSYTVWVRAGNTAGNSAGYATAAGTPVVPTTPPTADKKPETPTVVPGNAKLTLKWTPVSDVPSYKLYYGTTNDFSQATPVEKPILPKASPVSGDITGLVNGTSYYVWVQSWNSASTKDNSPVSDPASGIPQAKAAIDYSNTTFSLGSAGAEFVYAQTLPPSVFNPTGRPNSDRMTRVQETGLGNLFTDGAAWYIRDKYPEQNISFVFLHGAYIDNVLPAGDITVGSLSAIVRTADREDKFVLLSLTGAQLKAFFDEVADVVHSGRGGPSNTAFFGNVSSEVHYTLQYRKPPELTQAIIDGTEAKYSDMDTSPYTRGRIKAGTLKINGVDIDDTKTYRICTTETLATGAFFDTLLDGINKVVTDDIFWHGVAEYIYDQGADLIPLVDGRIVIEGGVPLPSPWVAGDWIYTEE
ncbi:fibronectin type III domain-containing protein [Treponema primitia]|uniref:fibronectin type III domain-containing protein n=1 Tax=Treponema primitia TaxID=88058 RepID=UPI000255500E|nr:5'-nucleotidase C-terminal domain-containing protein [Treponema primitia]